MEGRVRRGIFILLLLVLLPALSFAGEYRVLAQDAGSITVVFTPGQPVITRLNVGNSPSLAKISIPGYMHERIAGRPVLPVQRYFFEVPAEGQIRLQVIDMDASVLEGILPEVWFDAKAAFDDHIPALSNPLSGEGRDFAVIAGTGVYRRRNLALVDLYPVLYDRESSSLLYARSITVKLSFPTPVSPREPLQGNVVERFPVDRVLVNASQASGWHGRKVSISAARSPFEFALSDNWLKLTVTSTGLYNVTYNDLFSAGINPIEIDPSAMRLFSAGPLQQPDLIDDGGSFQDDYHMTEIPFIYEGIGSGSFSPGESIIFYGVGISGWMNSLDPSAGKTEYYEHDYAKKNVYWLTWGGTFPDDPVTISQRDVSPGGVAPDTVITTYEHRMHVERDYLYDPNYTEDGWYWKLLGTSTSTFTDYFYLNDVSDGTGTIRTLAYGPARYSNTASYYINGSAIGSLTWYTKTDEFLPETLLVDVSNLHDSANEFKAIKGPDNKMYVMWYDVYYSRYLEADGGVLDYFAPPTSGSAGFSLGGFLSDDIYLLDVTLLTTPVILSGFQYTGGLLEFRETTEGAHHYLAVSASALEKPGIEVVSTGVGQLASLRDDPVCPHMLIIYNSKFRDAAGTLRDYRSSHLPYVDNPVVRAVDVEEVYDNFSNGLKDPVAIRNYLKFLYDNFLNGSDPVIRYLLLFGNGIYDSRDILKTGLDHIPLYMNYYGREFVEDDDYYARLDEGDDRLIDLAIGRFPVLSARHAQSWVEDIINYESDSDFGEWRNEVILLADDEYSTHTNCDFRFIIGTEHMTRDYSFFPDFIDFKKIYLHHYPFSGGLKPEASSALFDAWNDGALIVNYVGHGSAQQMADERVMQKSDIFSLMNGRKKPLFLAFSCSVGDIESPYQRSIGQELVASESGGAIAVIAGSGGTLAVPNRELYYSIFRSMFTSQDSTGTEPLGITMMLAKPCCTDFGFGMNSAQYILLGDPAMRLALPHYKIEHDVSNIDTMYTGKRYQFDGMIISGGSLFDTFNGVAEIIVQESREQIREENAECDVSISYDLPGKEIFRGSVDVTAGRFSVEFVVPVRCRVGAKARVRTYVSSDETDGVGADEYMVIFNSTDIPENEGPPDIHIYFEGQATRVKQGASLVVEISDPDGIALLGRDPQSSIFLEFDKSGYPIFVTDYFNYDHGSSTTGRVEYPLHSGFSPGPHSVIVRAFDNLGEFATDTLQFEVVEEGLYTVSDIFNMPNPFKDSTNFVFQLSSSADVVLRIFNLSGREIWAKKIYGEEGFNSIYWDGRDYAGDRPANGTYLYFLDVSFRNSFNRRETVKGKVVLIR